MKNKKERIKLTTELNELYAGIKNKAWFQSNDYWNCVQKIPNP